MHHALFPLAMVTVQINCVPREYTKYMRRSRKFCNRDPTFKRGEDPNKYHYKRAIIGPPAKKIPGRVAQSVTCLATDACLTADPGVASSIPARYHTFVEIDHEIISTVILLLPLIYSRRVVVSYKRKYVHKLLVNRLLKPAQEKVWLSELTVPQ